MSFKDISDLYITVANAPKARLDLKLSVNSTSFTFKNIKSNMLKIPGIFRNKNRYNIFIESHLYDERDKVINGINIKYSIEKK